MNTNNNDMRDRDDRHDDSRNENNVDADLRTEADDLGINKTVTGEDRSELGRQERRHHEEHGNRKYKSFSNHSSADDQPATDTGA